jgi:hypothetical protein
MTQPVHIIIFKSSVPATQHANVSTKESFCLNLLKGTIAVCSQKQRILAQVPRYSVLISVRGRTTLIEADELFLSACS